MLGFSPLPQAFAASLSHACVLLFTCTLPLTHTHTHTHTRPHTQTHCVPQSFSQTVQTANTTSIPLYFPARSLSAQQASEQDGGWNGLSWSRRDHPWACACVCAV